ncbi:MAG: DUF4234 domain-containing protein [Marmoricola sp.]
MTQPPFPPPPSPYGVPLLAGGPGPLGRQRPTGTAILLFIVTLGIYGYVWIFQVHEELKRHSHDGIGGGLALVLWFFTGQLVMGFLTPQEVGKLYQRRGQQPPVTAITGLWATLGLLLCGVGPIVWFVQTNNALNDYWASLGAP